MPVDPAGHVGVAMKNLRNLIASSALFQTLVGAGDLAAALPFVHYHKVLSSAVRPLAIVGAPSDLAESETNGADSMQMRGVVSAMFVVDGSTFSAPEDDWLATMDNYCDGILAQMIPNKTAYFDFVTMNAEAPEMSHEHELQSVPAHVTKTYRFQWGPSPAV